MVRTISDRSSFFPLRFMACTLPSWAINQRGKNLVHNLRYRSQTCLVRGIYGSRNLSNLWNGGAKYIIIAHQCLRLHSVAWPPPISLKPKNPWTIYHKCPAFFHRRKCKISFVRQTAFTGISKWNHEVRKFSTSSKLCWQKRQVTNSLIFSCSLSPATIAWPRSFCHVSVFSLSRSSKFFRNFWSPCTKCWFENRQVTLGAWLLVQLLNCSWSK